MESVNNTTELNINSYIDSMADKLYKQYSFLHLSEASFKTLIIDRLKDEITTGDIHKIDDVISKKLLFIVRGYLNKLQIEDNDLFIIIISDYFDDIYKSEQLVKKAFMPFGAFLKLYNIELSDDDCKLLIAITDTLCMCLNKMLITYVDVVKNENYTKNFTNNIKRIIEVYSDDNDIDFEFGEDDKNISNSCFDSEKAYYRVIDSLRVLSKDEEKELATGIISGDNESFDKLIHHNLRLVKSIASMYIGRGLDFEDLVQEGTIGLMKAVRKFNPDKEVGFATYAKWWINAAITNAIYTKSRTITLPKEVLFKYYKVIIARNEYVKQYDKNPTVEELSEITKYNKEMVEYYLSLEHTIISLDELLTQESNVERKYYISNFQESADNIIIRKSLVEDFKYFLDSGILNEKEIKVLVYKYGLGGGKPLSIHGIAEMLKIGDTAVTCIEYNALDKLYENEEFRKKMAGYIDVSSDYHKVIRSRKIGNKKTDEEVDKEKINIITVIKDYLSINVSTHDYFNHYCELGVITEKEAQVLNYRFGMKIKESKISTIMSESRPRISYIETNALFKLIDNNEFSSKMNDYIDMVSKYYNIIYVQRKNRKKVVDKKGAKDKKISLNDFMKTDIIRKTLPSFYNDGVISEYELKVLEQVYQLGITKEAISKSHNVTRSSISVTTSKALEKLLNNDRFRAMIPDNVEIPVFKKKEDKKKIKKDNKPVSYRTLMAEYLSVCKPSDELKYMYEHRVINERELKILLTKYIDELPIEEIAKELGMSKDNTYSRTTTAFDKLVNDYEFRKSVNNYIKENGYELINDNTQSDNAIDSKTLSIREYLKVKEAYESLPHYCEIGVITQEELELLNYVYATGYSKTKVAELLNMNRSIVSRIIINALKKLNDNEEFASTMKEFFKNAKEYHKITDYKEAYFIKKDNNEENHFTEGDKQKSKKQ